MSISFSCYSREVAPLDANLNASLAAQDGAEANWELAEEHGHGRLETIFHELVLLYGTEYYRAEVGKTHRQTGRGGPGQAAAHVHPDARIKALPALSPLRRTFPKRRFLTPRGTRERFLEEQGVPPELITRFKNGELSICEMNKMLKDYVSNEGLFDSTSWGWTRQVCHIAPVELNQEDSAIENRVRRVMIDIYQRVIAGQTNPMDATLEIQAEITKGLPARIASIFSKIQSLKQYERRIERLTELSARWGKEICIPDDIRVEYRKELMMLLGRAIDIRRRPGRGWTVPTIPKSKRRDGDLSEAFKATAGRLTAIPEDVPHNDSSPLKERKMRLDQLHRRGQLAVHQLKGSEAELPFGLMLDMPGLSDPAKLEARAREVGAFMRRNKRCTGPEDKENPYPLVPPMILPKNVLGMILPLSPIQEAASPRKGRKRKAQSECSSSLAKNENRLKPRQLNPNTQQPTNRGEWRIDDEKSPPVKEEARHQILRINPFAYSDL